MVSVVLEAVSSTTTLSPISISTAITTIITTIMSTTRALVVLIVIVLVLVTFYYSLLIANASNSTGTHY